MALVVKDRVKQTTTTTGTGSIVLNGNVDGFQTFAAALANGDTTYYGIFVPSTNAFEVGLGTWTESSATLARTTILESSNSGSAVNLTAQAEVFITQPAEKAVFQDSNGDVDLGGNKILFGNLYSTTGDLPSASTYHGMFAHVHGTGKAYYAHGGNWIELVNEDTSGNVSMGGNLTVTGDLTVNGTTTTVNTTNTVVTDSLIELGNGTSGSPSNDAGIVIERGSSDNAFIGYDESADKFTVGTGSFTGASTGNLTISTGTLVANVEGNVTGNVTGNADTATTAGTVTTAAQSNITSVGTLTSATISGDLTVDTSTLKVDSSNNRVGIGTASPSRDLTIKGFTGFEASNSTNAWAAYTYTDNTFRLNYNGAGNDEVIIDTSGNMTVNGSLTVDDITINGSTISDGGDLTVDVGGNIVLDADGGGIYFKDAGTTIGILQSDSGDFKISSSVSDKDIKFIGNDGGSTITALTLDMSDAGAATFNAGATFSGNIDASSNTITGSIVNGNSYVYTPTIYLNDTIYHTNDTNTYINFATDEIRLAAGGSQEVTINTTGVRLGDTGNGYFQPVSSDYGSIQIDGGAHNGWEGYNIGGRAVFMHNNSTQTGIYNDVDNEWLIQCVHNAEVNLYHNGSNKLQTNSTGANIEGDLNAVDNIYLASELVHEGDTDTKLVFDNNVIYLNAGGVNAHILTQTYTSTYVPTYNYAAYFEEAASLSGTTPTINAAASGVFYLTMSGNTTFTFTNTSSNWGVGFVLYLTGNGGTVTWPASVDWAGGTAPDAPANGETDVLVFHTRDGSNWVGVLSADAAA